MERIQLEISAEIKKFIDNKVLSGEYANPSELITQMLTQEILKEENT